MRTPFRHDTRRSDRGQIIVVFALSLIAIVAMVGLVLDGGSTFAQRRNQQNAADMAAIAAANTYLLTNDANASTAAARTSATENGFEHGVGGITVTTAYDLTNGAAVSVDIAAPHRNTFTGVVGITEWTVATTATALTGIPNGANGAAPFIFSIDAFGPNGEPNPAYADPDNPFGFNADNSDAPTSPGDLAWTDFAYDKPCEEPGNVDANTVKSIIDESLIINTTVNFGCYVGQHNNGNMTTIYDDVDTLMAGHEYPVPVVDDGGNFQGWATFHVTSASGGSDKKIFGYFVTPNVSQRLTVGCPDGTCPRYLGTYVLKLVN